MRFEKKIEQDKNIIKNFLETNECKYNIQY